MAWWSDRPDSDSPDAIAKVFELARIAFGMMLREEADDWDAWLERVKNGEPEPVDPEEWTLGELANIFPETQTTMMKRKRGRPPGGTSRCSTCRTLGHTHRTCPLNRIEVVIERGDSSAREK